MFENGGIRAAIEAKETGKIRHIGFMGHRDPRNHKRMLDKPFDWETVQMPINMMEVEQRTLFDGVREVAGDGASSSTRPRSAWTGGTM